jgi:peptidoglycan/LPS O-acetylase OafA/YrhL
MRAIACILVVLLHISVKGSQYGNGALQGFSVGGAGVDLFFIISGYIMCASTAGRHLNFYQFSLLRIKRIIPLYWLTTTAALVIYLYYPQIINTSGGETSIWASYTLFPNGKRYLNSNGWTLSYEFFFYIIFAFFINNGTYKAILGSSAILLALVIIGQLFNYEGLLFKFSTHTLYIEFVFGMGCFYLFHKGIIRLAPKYGITLCMLGSLLLVLELFFKMPVQDKWRAITWGIPMLFIFIGLLCLEGFINRNTSMVKNLFLEIGNSSYSLYLIQPFTLSGTAMCLKLLKMTSSPYLFTFVLLAVSIVVGHLVYLYVERPLISLIKNPVLQSVPWARSRAMEKVS